MCSQMGKTRFHFILNSGPFSAALWDEVVVDRRGDERHGQSMLSDWKCNLHLSVGPWRSCGR